MKQLPEKIRDTLIAIGQAARAGEEPSVADIASLRPHDSINRARPEFWKDATADLSDEEVGNLTCGLAYVEAQLRWLGGSVSGVIWLFQALVARGASITLLDDISGWVIEHTKNPYNPFGTQVSLGASTYSEYQSLSSSRAVEIGKCIQSDSELEERAEVERQLRREMAAAGADARSSEVRTRIIESFETLTLTEKLEKISSHPTFPPQFFHTSIADAATQEVIDSLPSEVQVELARRLKGKRKGPWGSFRKRLTKSLGPIWNKKPWRV
jgi:uncharacterized FlaG/YvyC family protein